MQNATPVRIEYTQQGMARLIAERMGGMLRYDHKSHCWIVRTPGIGDIPQPKQTKMGFKAAMQIVQAEQGKMTPEELRATGNASFYNGVESILRQTMMDFTS